jgi:hypothetical protein
VLGNPEHVVVCSRTGGYLRDRKPRAHGAGPNRSYEIAVESAGEAPLIILNGSEVTRDMPLVHSNAIFLEDANPLVDWQYDVPHGGHRPITLVFATERTAAGMGACYIDFRENLDCPCRSGAIRPNRITN